MLYWALLLLALTVPLGAQSSAPYWKLRFYGQSSCTNEDGTQGTQVIQISADHLVTDNPNPQNIYPDAQEFKDFVAEGLTFAVLNNDGTAQYSISGCGFSQNSPPASVQDNNFSFMPDADGSGNGTYYATAQVGDTFCGSPQFAVKFDTNNITVQGFYSNPTSKIQCAVVLAGPNATLPQLPIGPSQPTPPPPSTCPTPGNCPLQIISSSFLPDAREGFFHNTTITAVGGVGPYHWDLLSTDDGPPNDVPKELALPPSSGLVVTLAGQVDGNYSDHNIFPASTFFFKIRITDHRGNRDEQILSVSVMPRLDIGPVWDTPKLLPEATEGVPYFGYLQGIGGDNLEYNKQWTVTGGSLPKGITLGRTGSDGIFSGKPAAGTSGTYQFVVHLDDGFSAPADAVVVLNVFSRGAHPLRVITTGLPDATDGQSLDYFIAASGGSGGNTWTLLSGAIPGMSFHASGELSGTVHNPRPAPYQISVQVVDSKGDRATGVITILIMPKPGGPLQYFGTGTLPNGSLGQTYSQQISMVGGKPPYHVQLTSGSLPAGLSLTPGGLITGTPASSYNATATFLITDATGATVQAKIHITISATKIPNIQQVQPDTLTENSGQAQITVTTSSSAAGMTVLWNGQALSGVPHGDTIKATVPSALTQFAGQAHLTLVASDGSSGADFVYPVLSTQPAYLTSPAQGTLLSGTVNFSWQQATAAQYSLSIGSTGAGTTDLLVKSFSEKTGSYSTIIPSKGETVYVRLSSQMPDGWHHSDYQFHASAAPPPPASGGSGSTPSATATLLFKNSLLYPVSVTANGTGLGTVPASNSASMGVTVTPSLVVSFQVFQPTVADRTLGDPMSGQYQAISTPVGTIEFDITNLIGNQYYFVPIITNTTGTDQLLGVNMGLQAENRCQCIVPANTSNVSAGYYLLYNNSNVELFSPQSNYTGQYTYWGLAGGASDTSLVPFVESKTGALRLKH